MMIICMILDVFCCHLAPWFGSWHSKSSQPLEVNLILQFVQIFSVRIKSLPIVQSGQDTLFRHWYVARRVAVFCARLRRVGELVAKQVGAYARTHPRPLPQQGLRCQGRRAVGNVA
eukprot:6190200-Pleurochrysis_carterae.AAC.1